MEPDLLPVVMSTDDVEPLAVPVVALTRSRGEGPLVVALPVNVDAISRAAVYRDLLSGEVIQTVLALGTSSHSDGGSSAIAPPMDMEDSPLLETGLPGARLDSRRTAVRGWESGLWLTAS